jgi:hypothetical protein
MKLVKSLLLGSAAGLVAVASAQAADLPTKKAAPAEYVRVCDAYGAGFFYIPGTQTCLRISGRVRAEYAYQTNRRSGAFGGMISSARSADDTGMRARARVNLDARTQTSWGTLRAYMRYELTSNRGAVYGTNSTGNAASTDLVYAFIQFAGITAGKAQSFFDFYANDLNFGTLRTSDHPPILLAYTATFGGGFSATLSLEDAVTRRSVVNGTYGGHRYPDLVGALRVDQGWGSAQLSGMVGQRNLLASAGVGATHKDFTVWGVQGGVKFNLPMLAAGDYAFLQAAYAQGAQGYTLGGTGLNADGKNGLIANHADALWYAVPGGTRVAKSKSWSALAGLLHYWTPSVRQSFMVGYAAVKYPGTMRPAYDNASEWRVGTNVIWSPVAGFDIGLELMYAKVHNSLRAVDAAAVRAAGLKKDPDSFQARLRLQRDF